MVTESGRLVVVDVKFVRDVDAEALVRGFLKIICNSMICLTMCSHVY